MKVLGKLIIAAAERASFMLGLAPAALP